jgi:Arc/MetJ-type ribon-helix-helix transcriptional regulator
VEHLCQIPVGAESGCPTTVANRCRVAYDATMSREATINVSLTPQQLRGVRMRVSSGEYQSASELIRDSLRLLFRADRIDPSGRKPRKKQSSQLAAAYRACARRDREIAAAWAQLPDAWPER